MQSSHACSLTWAFITLLLVCKGLNLFSYYKNETYVNRTSWGSAFGFGIEDVRFMQIDIIESSYIGTCKVRFKQGSAYTGFTVVCKTFK